MASLQPNEIGAAIRAFMAEKCPACRGKKELITDAFYPECLSILSDDLRKRVSDRKRFINAFHSALAYIKLNRGGNNFPPENLSTKASPPLTEQ